MDAVGLPVVHRDPVGIELGGSVGRPRIEWRLLILWYLLRLAIEFRCGSLVEPRAFLQLENPDRLKNTQSSKGIGVGGIFRRLEAHLHVALGSQVIKDRKSTRLNSSH